MVYWNWNNLFEQAVDLKPQIAYLNQRTMGFKFLSQRTDIQGVCEQKHWNK
ncbi:hypothetical protein [Microcoleus sp. OTE_8_concoct_300]|uniref:hypothetical protein n=1 Tax=Microcoleus sp. OTE_8_concoct_300 TaxID=2964710 RepID=UPI00403F306B